MSATQPLRIIPGMPTSDGAGVKLRRVIGSNALPDLDPFLLFDEFGTDQPQDYLAGFPEHPHRGFETVTYMLDGRMRHRDNKGNQGLLVPGSVQWMTAGSGLVHSEMPEQVEGAMRGFQLWVNLPAAQKMTAPRYQEFAPEAIPSQAIDGGTVKVIAGHYAQTQGPIQQPATEPLYADFQLDPGACVDLHWPTGHHGFVYAVDGELVIGAQTLQAGSLAILPTNGPLQLVATNGARALLIAARPIREPVARHGPFVMNTREQLMQAFVDYQQGRM